MGYAEVRRTSPQHSILSLYDPKYAALPYEVDTKDKIQDAEEIDQYISAELPDPILDPDGHKVISEMMVHGPCGLVNANTQCMKEGRCSKKFLKKYNNNTFFDKAGYVHYRRRETEVYTTRRGVELDNNYTVPYNRTDRIMAQVTRPVGEPSTVIERTQIQTDEIKNFVDGRKNTSSGARDTKIRHGNEQMKKLKASYSITTPYGVTNSKSINRALISAFEISIPSVVSRQQEEGGKWTHIPGMGQPFGVCHGIRPKDNEH
ncbi:hypothetical protein Tco_0367282 [Tanacetum coccineum]